MIGNLIDPEAWEMFKAMAEPAMLVELLDSYLDDAPQLIQQMKTGIAAGQIEEVRRAAHSLKSNSASFGARALTDVSRQLEMIAKGGTLDGAESKLAEIDAQYSLLLPVLMEMKNDL
jgi:HPt (histidine-containing phosphotransfer) domain-containing protein